MKAMWYVLLKQVCILMVLICSCTDAALHDTTLLRFDPANLSVLEGNSGTLTCNITNSELALYNISWNGQTSKVHPPKENCTIVGSLSNTQVYNVSCIKEDVQITILHVTRVRHDEVWSCRRNINGVVYQSDSTITVRVPITNVQFEPQREHTIIKENTPTEFVCVTSAGYPKATIRWFKNNTQLNNSNVSTSTATSNKYLEVVSSTLTLHLTRNENSSQIYCTANNNGTTKQYSKKTSVIVYYGPDVPIISKGSTQVQGDLKVIEGNEVNVICTASSFPEPKFSWIIPNGTNIERLHITNISRNEEGNYTCTANNTMKLSSEQTYHGVNATTLKVLVLYPPSQPMFEYRKTNNSKQFNMTDKFLRVVRTDSFTLTCSAYSQPQSTLQLTVNPHIQDTNVNKLTVVSIQGDMNLTCTATNTMIETFGMNSTQSANSTISIIVEYPPEAIHLKVNGNETTTNNNPARVVEGSNVTVSCDASSKPSPSKYTWFKLPSTTLPTSTTREYNIVRINRTQAGKYTCIVEYVMHPSFEKPESGAISKNLSLEVLYPTEIDSFKANGQPTVYVTVNETDNITFICNVEGKPESNVSILHEDIPLKHATVMNNVTHTLTNVSCVQQGQYSCAANNMYNTERPMKNLTLFIRCSPRPKPNSELQEVFASALNVDTTISFEVFAYPAPTDDGFKWEKEVTNSSSWKEVENNDKIQVSLNGMQSNLTLKNVSRLSFGNYRLTVTNDVGTYTHQFVLQAEDKPQAPTNFHHVKELATDSTLTFKWSPGFDGGPQQTFVLHYRRSNSKANWLVKSIPDNKSLIMNTTLGFLTSNTMYDVNLIASNEKGNSSAVNITAAQTCVAPTVTPVESIIPAVSGVAASVVVICIIVVIVVLHKRRRNKKASSKRHHGASTTNVSRGVYEIGPCETVFSHRNVNANKDETDSKSKIYQDVTDIQLSSSATSSKHISKAQAMAAPSKMIYQNLPGFNTKKKAIDKPKIKSKAVEKSSPQSLLEPDVGDVHCDRQNSDFVYGNVGRTIERVQVAELLTYVTSKSYESEYPSFLEGLQFPTTVAMKPQNIKLNRYQGIFPYDHSRVTLPDDPNFFMNACYIDGYNREKAYIASLGPTSDTTNGYRTFWKMVWQGQTDIIVMVTNLREITGMKCQQYWPELGTSITYGDVTVTSQAVTITAEYTVRVFSVSKSGVFRTLHQLHFTAWPDKGVPDDVTSILEFRNRIKSTSTLGTGPTIVHCSAGIGRTGTLIALDILIDEGKAGGSVNVSACVKRLREQRVNMVQTAEQYAFVHKALVYMLAFECETIHSETFQEYLESSTDMFFENMFKQIQPNLSRDAEAEARRRNEKYTKINRPGADIPGDKHSVKVYLNKDSDDVDYINAVYINSFKKKNHFISAQTPRISSEEDFLNLIFQEGCMCIVTFDQSETHGTDQDIGVYLPPENQNLTIGNFNVSCSRLETKPQYIVRRMKVENHGKFDSGEKISYHFQYTQWESDKQMPDDPSEFAQFIKDIDQYLNELGESDMHVLVHCMDASRRSGLFCSIATMIEKIECEGRVNVGNTIRQIRNRRMTVIQNMEQLRFCHQAVNAYINMKKPQ